METKTKFSVKAYHKDLEKRVKSLSSEELKNEYYGIYKLYDHLKEYYKDKYGSPKRLDDIRDIALIYCNELLERRTLEI